MSNRNDEVQAIIHAYEAGHEAYGNSPSGTRAPHTPGSELAIAWHIGWSVAKQEEAEDIEAMSQATDEDVTGDDPAKYY